MQFEHPEAPEPSTKVPGVHFTQNVFGGETLYNPSPQAVQFKFPVVFEKKPFSQSGHLKALPYSEEAVPASQGVQFD